MNYLDVKPILLNWAQRRSGQNINHLYKKFPKLKSWEAGKVKPTLKQLEKFAKTVHVPLGYLLLDKPPVENIPIPDFRKMPDVKQKKPSPNLLDTIYICQRRQNWYRNYMRSMKEQPLSFINSVQPSNDNIVNTARDIRKILKFSIQERKQMPTWTQALSQLIDQVNSIGVLIMVNGIVENNTHRKLDPKEFRGFALCDSLAPVVFINGADTKAAQMFTIAHELAHLWINQTAISNAHALTIPNHNIEQWCNKVAAELLVPLSTMRQLYDRKKIEHNFSGEVNRLAKYFKVSSLVILRRLYDMKKLTDKEFSKRYEAELNKLKEILKKDGGNFYPTFKMRVNPLFMKAVVSHTLEGHTPFKESFQLLTIKKMSTFQKIKEEVGVKF